MLTNYSTIWSDYIIPFGAKLIGEEAVLRPGGQVVVNRTYQQPATGQVVQTATPVAAEKRGELRPEVLPPLPTAVSRDRATALGGGAQTKGPDRRVPPRPDRDQRMPKDAADQAKAPGAERRTGGPVESFVTEIKAFFMTPAGIITVGLVLTGLVVMAARRRRTATG